MSKLSAEYSWAINALKNDFALQITEEEYRPEHFGNALLTLRGPSLWIRLVRERGQLFVDFAHPNGEWADGARILGSLGMGPAPDHRLTLQEYMLALKNHGEEIIQLLR
jgi:hypothetical protein